jgi:hypothetical protein
LEELVVPAIAPVTSAVAATPGITKTQPTITATLTESGPSSSNIADGEFFIDVVGANGAGTPMAAADGEFNSKLENVTQALTAAQFAALTNGVHTVYVHGKDVKGNWGPAVSVTFTKDTIPPAVSVTAPPAVVPAGTQMTIAGTSADAGSGVSGVQVTITGPGNVVLAQGPATNTGTGFNTWSFSYTPTLDGAETVSATATDVAGNVASSAPAGLQVGAGIDATGNLLVYGHPSASTILVDATTPAAAAVTINGTSLGPFAISAGGHVVIHAFDGGNTITLRGGVGADITSGAGNDTITADNLSAGTVNVDAGGGSNTLVVNTGGGPDVITVTYSQFGVAGGPTVNYTSVQTLTANAGAGADSVTVNASGAGLPGQINVNAGGDDDQVTVNLGAGVATTVNVDGGSQTAGDSVTVNGTAGPDVIALNGSTLTSGPTTVNLADIENVTVATAGGPDSIAVIGTTLTGALTLTGGDDVDAITLGNVNAGQLTATAESILLSGPVTTTGGQAYNGPVTLATTLTVAGGSLSFAGSVRAAADGMQNLTANATGAATFGGPIGDNGQRLGAVTITAGGDFVVGAIITSPGGSVSITAGGAILDGNGSADNITTNNLSLTAGAGIGIAADPLETVTITSGAGPNPTLTLTAVGGTGGIYLANTGPLALATATAAGSIAVTAQGPLTVTGPVSSTAGAVNLTATSSNLTVTGTTISAGGGNITLAGGAISVASSASIQAAGMIQLNSANVALNGAHLGATSNLFFATDNASVDLSGADFGTLTNLGISTSIKLNGADFGSLTNFGGGTGITIGPGSGFDSLTNSGSGVQIDLNGADFGSLTNFGGGTGITIGPGSGFDSLTNSGSGVQIDLNGADFGSLTNFGGGTGITIGPGSGFDSLTNSGSGVQIDLNGATFQTLVNGDAAEVAQIAANGADFSTLTDVAGNTTININGADFNTLVNAGSGTTIDVSGADFSTFINGGNATNAKITIDLNGVDFNSLYNYGGGATIGITGPDPSTPSDGVVNINLNGADFNTLVNSGFGSTINVTGVTSDTVISTAPSTTINLNGADFNTLVNSGFGATINVTGSDYDTLQNSGASAGININGADFESLVSSGGGTSVAVTASSFQFVENDGDNATLNLNSTGAGSSTVANNGNGVNVTYNGGPGDDVFVNDARGDTSHGNNVTAAVNLGNGNDRFVVGGTGVSGTLTGGSGDDSYVFVAGLTGDLTVQEAANADTDTLDFSNLTTGPVTLDLAIANTKQSVAPGLSLTLSSDTGIENVIGSQFADTISGNSRDNVLLGADLPDDRIGAGPAWNGRTQTVFLDFDSKTLPADHQYTAAERNAIQARLESDYHGPAATSDPSTWWFHVAFTQTKPAGVQNVDYVTVYFNQPRSSGGEGSPGVGGDSSDIDFGNRSFGGWASVDVKTTDPVTNVVTTLIGGPGQPPEFNSANTSDQSWLNDNWVRASSWIAAHEIFHLMGGRHADAFGPIGYGIHTPPGVNGFFISPTYNGLTGAFETNSHLIATPALTGFTLNDLVDDTFFGEREAVKLAYDQAVAVDSNGNFITQDGTLAVAQQPVAVNGSLTTAGSQKLTLASLTVPDTLSRGLNSIKQFLVGAVDVVGSINAASEKDIYRIDGRKGDLLNLQVMSDALTRYAGQAIDAVLTVYDSSGNVVATSDDEFESHDPSIIDLRLTKDDTYYVEVKNSLPIAHDGLGVTGKYELFAYRFDTANPTDGNDTLEGRAGNDTLAGGMGNDTYVFNGVNLGSDVIQEDVRYEAQNGTVGSRDSRDKLDFSNFGAKVTLDLSLTTPQVVSASNLTLQLSSALGFEDVVLPTAFNATVNGNARDNTFIFLTRPGGAGVADVITGQAGMDTLDYSAVTAGITVNLGTHNSTQTVGGGYGLLLPAEDMENVAGSATGADTLTGNTLNNVLIGGAGNDTMDGGAGNDIVIGNAGDDTMTGGAGDDMQIGGAGADRLAVSAGNDIVIAGSTSYDFVGYNPTKCSALLAILAEWTNAAETRDVRQAAIAGNSGSGHLNGGNYLNSTTVFTDNSVDKLTGSSGSNWFFVDNTADSTPVDTVTGNSSGAYFTYINKLPPI